MKVKLSCGHEVDVTEQVATLYKKREAGLFCEQCVLDILEKRRKIKKQEAQG